MTTDARLHEDPNYVRGGKRGLVLIEGHIIPTMRGGKPFNGRYIRYDPSRGLIHLLAGYSWDGASIPRLAQIIIRKDEKTQKDSLPHDAGYQLGGEGVWDGVKDARKRIDVAFFILMRRGTRWWQWAYSKAGIMYRAVRVGGASSFRKKT